MDHKSLSRQIDQYFENSRRGIHPVEVDFYEWLPTNEFVYKEVGTNTFRLWKGEVDFLMEELMGNISAEIDKEILNTLMQKYVVSKIK